MSDLRPEQVAKLTTTPPLPAELTDTILDSTDAERMAAAAELADRSREWLERIGALKPSASVLDLDFRRLGALAAVWATIEEWWKFPPYQQHTLGMMLKIIPPGHARWVEEVLAWGGFVPPPDPADEVPPRGRSTGASTSPADLGHARRPAEGREGPPWMVRVPGTCLRPAPPPGVGSSIVPA